MKKEQYAVMETILDCDMGIVTNLLAICPTRKEAVKKINEAKETHKRICTSHGMSEENYQINIDNDLDTVFDFSDIEGECEYHLLACKPMKEDYKFDKDLDTSFDFSDINGDCEYHLSPCKCMTEDTQDKENLKTYTIPIECYTSVTVKAKNLEEAINSLNRSSVTDYENTFSEWTYDKYGTAYKEDCNSSYNEDIQLNELDEEDYKNY